MLRKEYKMTRVETTHNTMSSITRKLTSRVNNIMHKSKPELIEGSVPKPIDSNKKNGTK